MQFTVKFKSWEDREKAENRLWEECRGGSNSVYGGQTTYGNYYYLTIYDNCTDFSKARRICEMYGGEIE